MIRPRIVLVLVACCSVALGFGAHTPALAQPFPRLGLYGSIRGDGSPFLRPDGSLDVTAIDAAARYDEISLDASPITPYHPEILTALRTRNPDIRCLAYVLGHDIWNAADPDSLHHYPTRYRRMVRDLDGFLYNRLTGDYYPGVSVNLAKQDGSGRFVVAEGLADLWQDAIASTGQWDGLMIDVYCSTISWSQDATRQIDYQRAGYPSIGAFDAAWTAASDTLARRLRRLVGPDFVIVGNCAASDHQASLNGWMRENFPFQNGGTWYDNMLNETHGYFADDRNFMAPPHNYIFTAQSGGAGSQYSSVNARKVRLGLGSAALGEGYGVFGPSDRNVASAPYHLYWYDEYAVDPATGRASGLVRDTGWLGEALGPSYQMIWAGTNPDAVNNPGFETDTGGWTLNAFAPAVATLARDASTSAVGAASGHVHVAAANGTDWYVNLSTTQAISVSANGDFSATFWARASSQRGINVAAATPAGALVASRSLTIGTAWKQYQVILQPSQTGTARLQFYLGSVAGDVWFDDVHFQSGATNLYRRDFTNGIVLVNPTTQALQVPLGATYRRILGTVDTATNNGAAGTSASVGASDALFLLRDTIAPRDLTPPAAIGDVRVQQP